MFTSLVTGGAGFIGAHVARELLKRGDKVIVLDDLSGGFTENLPEGVIFIEGSITDENLVKRIFREYNFDFVYHLAAYAAEGLSHFIRKFNYNNNLIGSINLINASIKHKVKTFVFTSSIAVYGTQPPPVSEENFPTPEDPYGVAKFAVEMDLKNAHDLFGLNYIVFRPHNVYGEFQNIGDRYRNVVGIFMRQLLEGKPLSVFGDGEQTRAFTYVGDVAPYIAESVLKEEALNQVFNIGSDDYCSVNELAQKVMKVMGIQGEIQYLPARHEVKHIYADHSKLNKIFNITSYTPLEEGLQKMADWVKKVGIRHSKQYENIEIMEKLPPSWAEALKQKQ